MSFLKKIKKADPAPKVEEVVDLPWTADEVAQDPYQAAEPEAVAPAVLPVKKGFLGKKIITPAPPSILVPAPAKIITSKSKGIAAAVNASLQAGHNKAPAFLKQGAAAVAGWKAEELKQQARAAKNATSRFYIPSGKETSITFLDGDISEGILNIPYYYEHQVHMNGSWQNWFVCTSDSEPCPICEGGSYASYVGVMTVIDHSEFTSKKDQQVHVNERRLFVAKSETLQLLSKHAIKHGGGSLRGCRFDVVRTGDKSAGVGSSFDFTERLLPQQLVTKYGKSATPYNYSDLIGGMYMTAEQLRSLGFGTASAPPVGAESMNGAGGQDFSSKL